MREAPWKRPTLLILSIFLLAAGGGFAYMASDSNQLIALTILSVSSVLLGSLGFVTSVVGCDKCVAQFIGDGP